MKLLKFICVLVLFVASCKKNNDTSKNVTQPIEQYSGHEGLISFFKAWRDFQAPTLVDGLPDYSQETMSNKYQELSEWKATLEAIDTTNWSVEHQVDWFIIWAEMNGMDFEHRVTKPWESDPRFYKWFFTDLTDAPAREGRNLEEAIEYAYYEQPLSIKDQEEIVIKLKSTDSLYKRAKENLVGNGRDLWEFGIKSMQVQSEELDKYGHEWQNTYPELSQAAMEAKEDTDDFIAWLEMELPSKSGLSGVGRENYSWNLRNVHLVPFDWEDAKVLLERELARGNTMMRLSEHKHRNLPPLTEIKDSMVFEKRFTKAVDEYLDFLESEAIVEVKPYFKKAMEQRIYPYTPKTEVRGFFSAINYLDPIIMRTHDYHWIELARIREEPHSNPIRREAPLYNIYDSRGEGLATCMEELMYQAGLLEDHPRSEELIALLISFRAARGLGALYQHDLQMTHAEACDFSAAMTPRNMILADGGTITWEQSFYLRQPSYGTSYLLGKVLMEQLIDEYARQRDDDFYMKDFMHEINGRGIIPTSLLYWEITGDRKMLDRALGR